jgi:hypothetical protein
MAMPMSLAMAPWTRASPGESRDGVSRVLSGLRAKVLPAYSGDTAKCPNQRRLADPAFEVESVDPCGDAVKGPPGAWTTRMPAAPAVCSGFNDLNIQDPSNDAGENYHRDACFTIAMRFH